MIKGKISWYNVEKGYGFIQASNGNSYFFHRSNCDFSFMLPDDPVEFEIAQSKKRPNSFEAVEIKKIFNDKA